MGCKFCKTLPYDNEGGVKRKKHRRSNHRKRRGRRSNRQQHPHHQHQSTEEIPPTENPPSQDDFNNSQYQLKPIPSVTDAAGSEHSVTTEVFVDIVPGDPEAFNQHLIQQRQQAIDDQICRKIIRAWQPNSLQQLVGIIRSFSKEKSPIDRHWMIFYWIACHIEYDTVAYFSKTYQDQSAEGVFRTRKGVCTGYANLYKYLSDQLQMPCEIISGYSKGYGFDNRDEAPSEIDHAWNAVEIDNHWYLVESTWGAGHLDEQQQFHHELTTYYFLPRPIEMIYHHLPKDEKWQLLRTPIKVSQFMQMPKVRPVYFEYNLQLVQPRNQYFVQLRPDKPYALVIIRTPGNIQLIGDLKLHDEKIDGGDRVIYDKKKGQYYCYFAPSNIGRHKIIIYAKPGETTGGTYTAALDLALNVKVKPKSPISYPRTWRCFSDFGLKILSPLRTHVIHLQDGQRYAQTIIRAPPDIQLIGQLKNANDERIYCADRVYYDRQKDIWRCKFAPDENGIFEAVILAKNDTDSITYTSAVSFQIVADQLPSPPLSFPNAWQLFYDLDLRILSPIGRGIITLTDIRIAEIRIKAPNDVQLMGRLRNDKNEDIPGGERVYYDHERDFWRCKFAPNQVGIYDAIILAKKNSDPENFISVVSFKIELKELSGQPACFSNTTQLFHDLKLKVISPVARHKIILLKKSSLVEITLKAPNDVLLLGQLVNSKKDRIVYAQETYYDRHQDIWHCKFAPNRTGLFEAIILAKKKSDPDLYSTVITYQIEVNAFPTPILTFPQTWQSFYDYDLRIESPQSSASVRWSPSASYAEVLIQAPEDVQLSCRTEYNNIEIERGSLAQFDNERKLWQLLFAPEQIGLHELIVYAKRITDIDSSANAVVKFDLDVTTLRQGMKFPMIYTQFETTKCRIYSPLSGILKTNSIVLVHCVIPGAEVIQITGDSKRVRSEGQGNSIFKREITVGTTEVIVYAKYSGSNHYTSIIRYSVE